MEIYSDQELSAFVERLNSLYSEYDGWRMTQARKDHTDEFRDQVLEGQTYFKREVGPAWDNVQKLSRASMETLIWCIFNGNFGLEKACDKAIEERRRRYAEAHQKFSPVKHLGLDVSN